ncbi:NAD-dependent dehydratase [Kaistia algarum]|uniref:NAD-dependent epimerase/dehydratase family protein n=1 Tax=Kaistia algarum TaxID=2083279 RepID=UPI000CE8BDC2|nr:NAD-dependent epimerase/dehydratase family protein [Kaistia algarum]MCX5515523.1 NAD-dependent epimerase/dehydratase family protein [Kaistia algarum]PPE81075.1 NAD-dependent dehydratase [Kaistia algarum]
MKRIAITGAAGLVGQNLVPRLKARGYSIVAFDKHRENTAILRELHPDIEVVEADLSVAGTWQDHLVGTDTLIILQAQIGGLDESEFVRNNVTATERLIETARAHGVGYIVQISSSVVNSRADDFYTRTKTAQEKLFATVEIPHVVLRPTLMFGWFDRKHLGWLRRFMDKAPVFPIPGDGRFVRQPLYAGDFAAIIASAVETRITGSYDISGRTPIGYGDLIRLIKDVTHAKARIVHIPYRLFWVLLWAYTKVDSNPPFTVRQLEALVIPETFPVIDWPGIFSVTETPLRKAIEETFLDERYAEITLSF